VPFVKLLIIAIGKLKDDAEAVLFRRYAERLDPFARSIGIGPLATIELGDARGSAIERKRAEASDILSRKPSGFMLAALDEAGETPSSAQFAAWLQSCRDEGVAGVAFGIGGADGHGGAVLLDARKTISLGRMTLTHGLARVLLAEQIYRACTIIAGHPYHRG